MRQKNSLLVRLRGGNGETFQPTCSSPNIDSVATVQTTAYFENTMTIQVIYYVYYDMQIGEQ